MAEIKGVSVLHEKSTKVISKSDKNQTKTNYDYI